jgi:hypothetical protein
MSPRALCKTVDAKMLVGALLVGLVPLLVLSVRGPVRAQTGGGVGAPGGTAAATIIVGDALGVPGGSAAVTFSFASEEGMANNVTINMVYDGTYLSLDPDNDCVRSPRLRNQLDSVGFPPNQPAPPDRRLRIGIFPPLNNPDATFTDGDLVTCTFGISADAPIGTQVDLILEEPLQVAAPGRVICGVASNPPEVCGAQDGVAMIAEATPTNTPTATFTQTEVPTNTPTNTPTQQATNTPTSTATPTNTGQITNTPTSTATPTNTGQITNTPTSTATPTNTGQITNTPTSTATPTNTRPTNTPTLTPTRQVTNTPTNTPTSPPAKQKDVDDSCAIVPVGAADPSRSLVLLLVPALLLWGRRRRS